MSAPALKPSTTRSRPTEARQGPDRPGRGRGLRRCPAVRALGVLQAAADAGKFSASASTQPELPAPGQSVLTSMLKRVDVATYNAFNDEKTGKLLDAGRHRPRPRRRRRRLRVRRQQCQALITAEMKAHGRQGHRRHQVGRRSRCTTSARTTPARSDPRDGIGPRGEVQPAQRPQRPAAAAAVYHLAIELIGINKHFGPVHANKRHPPPDQARHGARHRRRERRRQVDADVDPLRLLHTPTAARSASTATPHNITDCRHALRAGHRHGAPALHAGRQFHRPRERRSGRRGLARCSRPTLAKARTQLKRLADGLRPRGRSRRHHRGPLGGPAAARRNPQGALSRRRSR